MNEKQADAEGEVMKMYSESGPDERKLYNKSYVNHFAWSLFLVACAVIFWLLIALANAENQRQALVTKQCQDRVFKEEIDFKCLRTVQAREHWWQNVGYALMHTSPDR